MNQTEILAKLQGVFDKVFLEPPKLTRLLTAKEVPEWDSLLHISLVVAVEKDFGVRFLVGEVEATKNIGDFVDLIERRAKERAGR